jgi:hypothetical protein
MSDVEQLEQRVSSRPPKDLTQFLARQIPVSLKHDASLIVVGASGYYQALGLEAPDGIQ